MGRREGFAARRKHLDFSQESLAHHMSVSVSTVTSWERGRRVPSPGMRRGLAEALQVSLPELDRLLGIEAPIELNGHEVPTWLSHYDSLTLGAGSVWKVDKSLIPGLLQTKGYAEAVERASHLGLTDSDVIERVDARLARQAVLYRKPHPLQLTAIISETVFREVVGGPGVMAEQTDHVLAMAERPNITIRVLPADGRSTCVVSGFELLTKPGDVVPFMAVTFDVGGPHYHEDHVMKPFLTMAHHLDRVAENCDESIRRIRDTREPS